MLCCNAISSYKNYANHVDGPNVVYTHTGGIWESHMIDAAIVIEYSSFHVIFWPLSYTDPAFIDFYQKLCLVRFLYIRERIKIQKQQLFGNQ